MNVAANRFVLQNITQLDLVSDPIEGLQIWAYAHVSDELDVDTNADLVVCVRYTVESRRIEGACAFALLLPNGTEAAYTDADDMDGELSKWARGELELFKRCEQAWEQERELAAIAIAEDIADDLRKWRHVS
jgi:hypothetical protein